MFPWRGPPLTPFFLLPERSAEHKLDKGGRPKPKPKASSNNARCLESPSRKMAKLEAFGRTSPHPLVALMRKWVQAKPAAGKERTNDRATGKDARPARPAPDGRTSPLPAFRRLPACPGASPGPKPTVLQVWLASAPAPSSASMSPINASPRRGPVDLPASRTHCPAAATPASNRECEQPPACPPSSLSATPQWAPGPAAWRHLTEDPWSGTAPSRSCRQLRGGLRPVPRLVTAEPRAGKKLGRAWGPRAAA